MLLLFKFFPHRCLQDEVLLFFCQAVDSFLFVEVVLYVRVCMYIGGYVLLFSSGTFTVASMRPDYMSLVCLHGLLDPPANGISIIDGLELSDGYTIALHK